MFMCAGMCVCWLDFPPGGSFEGNLGLRYSGSERVCVRVFTDAVNKLRRGLTSASL